ncbi:MAG: aldehyde dehydrogenase family protein, partial [Dechloromonas sp.]|nr:aldehyde dehydrogenase family protein [Dechloromonas sp.]
MSDFGMTIGGARAAAAETFGVFNPSTGEEVGRAPNATPADLDAAVAAARAAFETWS